MAKQLDQLKKMIREEADKLICETHPHVCDLRDMNYNKLEKMVTNVLFQDEEPVSIQTAFAELERELGG